MMKSQARWHPALTTKLPSKLASWLTDQGSLTLRLQQTSEQQFRVDLMHTGWQKPLIDEALKLGQPLAEKAYCREVLLSDGDSPRVYARTIVPRASYQALQTHLHIHHLGNRSLGEILFSDPAIERGPLEVIRLQSGQNLFERAKQYGIDLDESATLWARRSCFHYAVYKLLICEIFLPNQDWS